MNFSCEKTLLNTALTTTSRATASKSTIGAMEGILIEASSLLQFTGYNLETGIRATIPAEITNTGSLVVPTRLFCEIIRKMPDDIVYFIDALKTYEANVKAVILNDCNLSQECVNMLIHNLDNHLIQLSVPFSFTTTSSTSIIPYCSKFSFVNVFIPFPTRY